MFASPPRLLVAALYLRERSPCRRSSTGEQAMMPRDMLRGHRIHLLAVVVAITAVAAATWRSGILRTPSDPLSHVRLSTAKGQQIYKGITTASIFDDFDALRGTLSSAPAAEQSAAVQAPLDELFDLAAQFFFYRVGQPDPGEYRRWRLRTGHRWRGVDELVSWYAAGDEFHRLFPSRELSGASDLAELFDALWTESLESRHAAYRPIAIATEPNGLRYSFAVASPGNPRAAPRLGEDSNEMIWHGASAAGGRCWFLPIRSREEIIASSGRVIVGQVAAVVEFADGTRCPVAVSALWDPMSSRWSMEGIVLYNRYVEGSSTFEY